MSFYDDIDPLKWDSFGGKPMTFEEIYADFLQFEDKNPGFAVRLRGQFIEHVPPVEEMEVCRPYSFYVPGDIDGTPEAFKRSPETKGKLGAWMFVCKDQDGLVHFYILGLSGASVGKMKVKMDKVEPGPEVPA